MAPTRSQCVSIYVSNASQPLSTVPLQFNGWYRRQSYFINRKWWWLKEDNTVSLKFFDGQWYLQEYNTALDTETMPNRLLTNNSISKDRPPDAANWIYAQYPQSSVRILATCYKTGYPTPAPTNKPTQTPTSSLCFFPTFFFFFLEEKKKKKKLYIYRAPQWTFCPNTNFFAFAKNQSEDVAVYWQVPMAKDDQSFSIGIWEWVWSGSSTPDESQTKVSIMSGVALTPGKRYKLEYIATDIYQVSSNCTVNIYVINTAPYNSYDSCFQNGFAIDVTVNQDTYSAEDPTKITYGVDSGEISGQVYWPSLAAQNISCYVKARMVGQVAAKASVTATTKYLGVTAQTTVWQVFILILVLIVLCLFAEAVRRRVIEYRSKKKPEAEQNLIRSIDATGEDKDAIMAGVAPAKLLRKATLQSTIDPSGRRNKSEGGGADNGQTVELAEVKSGDGNFNISNAPASPRRPSDNDTTDAAAPAAPEENAAPKAPPVLPQLPRPLLGTSSQEENDDAGGNDAVLNMLEQDWQNADEDADVVPPMELPNPKLPAFSSPPQKQPETGDDMDLGENDDVPEHDSEVIFFFFFIIFPFFTFFQN
ncbi:hypothetical protein RFI_37238 [Reticulomyxa filosa]|uniref:HYR domain-containing protein n=1 Tax=Reticulomyxa filosa TaxID=46433 RepID=X6LF57_RETFI|nr:hypothetical protein RFI_37238 [Reticulomyxa filosa]|eukprot:ETO00209.1 hypothetical protein RFI_37238 [Reticulomyxa filosa]